LPEHSASKTFVFSCIIRKFAGVRKETNDSNKSLARTAVGRVEGHL
jgi:hypothetical protein